MLLTEFLAQSFRGAPTVGSESPCGLGEQSRVEDADLALPPLDRSLALRDERKAGTIVLCAFPHRAMNYLDRQSPINVGSTNLPIRCRRREGFPLGM
jgi:hypothetical protein